MIPADSAEATAAYRPDTPRAAYRLLSKKATAAVVVWLLILAAIAWFFAARHAALMSDMAGGLAQIGARPANDMAIPGFMAMWVAMMIAMMFPAVAPLVLAHRLVVKRRGGGLAATASFVAGYLFVWSLIGVVPLLAFLWFRSLSGQTPGPGWLPAAAGGVLLVAGIYQFTRWKAVCLRACRTPLAFVLQHDFGAGSRSAFRSGFSHGAYCLGCCWALMSVLLVVGLMNLAWMVGLAVIFLVEKHWRHGMGLTRVAGAALIILGCAVILEPSLLRTISGAGNSMPPMQGQVHNMP